MKFQKTICLTLSATLFLSGCASTGDPLKDKENNDTALRCAAFGIGGAIVGKLVGGNSGAAKGAIAGLAACAIIEIASRQTKSANEVDRQYKATNRNQLPPSAKVDSYMSVVTPNGVAKAGDPIRTQSTIRVVSGTQEPIQEVKEVFVAFAPDGSEFKRGEKKVNDYGGSGEYENSFTLKLPQGAPQGIYRLTTQVFVNGRASGLKETSMQVATIANGTTVAMLDR
jgi:hypothetical protein